MAVSFKAVAIVGLAALVCGLALLHEPVKFSHPYEITPYNKERTLFSDSGVISGVRDCGGSGRVVKFRYEYCTTGLPPPCVIPVNGNARAELVFVPSEESKGLTLKNTITTSDGETKVYVFPFPDVSLVAGQEFALHTAGGATKELQGKQLTSRLEIYRESDKHIEMCAEADFIAV